MRFELLTATAGPDGTVNFSIKGEPGRVYEVQVTVAETVAGQPSASGQAVLGNIDDDTFRPVPPAPEALGWPAGYFETTAGALPDFDIEPRDPGAFEPREEL